MNQELENYIKQEKAIGTSDELIKQKLINNGWKEESFSQYFTGGNFQKPSAAPMPSNVNNQPSGQTRVSDRNKKIGIFWLVAPTLLLILILVIYAIMNFQMNELTGVEPSGNETYFGIFNVVLGFLGIIAILGIIAGIPIGIVYLNKKEYTNITFDPRSGHGNLSEIPPEIKGWNWGAAGLTWIWGLSNGVWISLLVFIPYFGAIWWIFLGAKGNKWAWQHSQWQSVEDFQRTQDKWKPWGMIFLLLPVLIILFVATSVFNFIIGD